MGQEVILFDGTIEENIRFGNTQVSFEEIAKILYELGVSDFVQELQKGYPIQIGENGMRLSGGQRQRIAIARALLKKAKIIILDEATSALDNISEQNIQNVFHKLQKSITIIAIAHRLSTIVSADKICLLEKGRICEEGFHDD